MNHRAYSARLHGLAAAVLLAAAGNAAAQTYTLAPVRDATLFADSGAIASGSGPFAFVGETNNGFARRTLVQFDLATIAPGSVITGASFSILVDRAGGDTDTVGLHRMLASWGEGASDAGSSGGGTLAQAGDATWSHRFFGTTDLWSTPGGDFAAGASALATLGAPNRYTWNATPAMLADLQGWLDQPSTNFGWALVGTESGRSARRFGSSENPIESLRPQLTLNVSPIPEPSTVATLLGGLGLLWTLFVVRARRR